MRTLFVSLAALTQTLTACGDPSDSIEDIGFTNTNGSDLWQQKEGQRPNAPLPHDCLVPDVTILNFGQAIYHGTVDVTPTLVRIVRGEHLPFPHDGTVFTNREGRLPKAAPAFYHEYVDPTPGISGPGPQRVVLGGMSAWFYTPDHYASFVEVHCG